uniref:Secreted protein n=1 Tax=Rhipicephalus appendiculatus TaxID=34631 RepID=A0A131YGN0_RHIAP
MPAMKLGLVLLIALAFMVANISSADLELRHPPYPPELYPQCLFLPCHGPLKDRCRPGCFCTRVGKNKLCMSIKGERQRRHWYQLWRPRR